MWVKHSAQHLAYSPHWRNISCGCYLLNQCLWKEGGVRGKAGESWEKKAGELAPSTFLLKGRCPLPCILGTSLPCPLFSRGCFESPRVRCWVRCQWTLPRAGGQPGPARAHPGMRTVSLRLEPPSPEDCSGPGGSHPPLDPAVPQKLPVT